MVDMSQTLANIGQHLTKVGRLWPSLGRLLAARATFRQLLGLPQ